MEIIKKYPENMDAMQVYMLTVSKSVGKLSELKGARLNVEAWVRGVDADRNGEAHPTLYIKSADGQRVATNSPTFIESFDTIVGIFGDAIPPIAIVAQRSKNGREYMVCDIAVD